MARTHHAIHAATWHATASYLWILRCDRPDLAWEYLRRNPEYQSAHPSGSEGAATAARHWGLAAAESPLRNADDAQPIWLRCPSEVRRLQQASGVSGAALSLWAVPGHKQLIHDGRELLFHAMRGAEAIRLALAADFVDGSEVAWLVPAGTSTGWAAIRAYDAWLFGGFSNKSTLTPSSLPLRASVVHMYTLQALDGVLAGATHREIATVLFGAEHVARAWHADGDLRARTRFLIHRGLRLMRGGYVDLLCPPTRAAARRAKQLSAPRKRTAQRRISVA